MAADPDVGIAAAKRSAASITRSGIRYVMSLPRVEGDWRLSVEHDRIVARADGCNVIAVIPPNDASGDGA